MSLFCETASASSALADAVRARPNATVPTRVVAIAAGRLAAALAALVCIPLVVLSGGSSGVLAGIGILAAALPSVLTLAVLNRDDAEAALAASATALATLSAGALLAGGATVGLTMLALAGLIEAVIHGGEKRRRFIFGALMFSALVGAISPLLQGQGGLSGGRIESAVIVSAVVALVQGTVSLLAGAQRMLANESSAMRATRRMQDLMMALRDVALTADRSGRVMSISDNVEAALGLKAGDLQGRGLLDRTHVADRPALLKAMAEAILDRRPVSVDLRLRIGGFDGIAVRHLWIETRIAPMAEPDHAVLVLRDVTAREEELQRLRSQDSLRQAATRNRGLFISSLSHELRTPLNAVIGFSEMLSNPDLPALPPETVREYAGIVHASGEQLFRIVMATIDLIRLDSGTYETNPEALGLSALVDGCIESVSEAAEARNVDLRRDVAPFLPDIVADRRALREALVQVLANAIKFAPAGSEVAVSVRTSGRRVILGVEDRGPGIAPEHLAHICDPFFQGDGSYDRSVSGAGLGLALVKRLVDLVGGELKIRSELGEGTVIEIAMPLEPPQRAQMPEGEVRSLELHRQSFQATDIHDERQKKSA